MKKRNLAIISFLLFFITFFWIQFSPWSSTELEKYNNGYGTFDMKTYHADTIYKVLDSMEPQGFTVYQGYFLGDYLFILSFIVLQSILFSYAFNWTKSGIIRTLALVIPIARGVFDILENTLLLYILRTYPHRHDMLAEVSHTATSLKLYSNYLGFVFLAVGFLVKIYFFFKKKERL